MVLRFPAMFRAGLTWAPTNRKSPLNDEKLKKKRNKIPSCLPIADRLPIHTRNADLEPPLPWKITNLKKWYGAPINLDSEAQIS